MWLYCRKVTGKVSKGDKGGRRDSDSKGKFLLYWQPHRYSLFQIDPKQSRNSSTSRRASRVQGQLWKKLEPKWGLGFPLSPGSTFTMGREGSPRHPPCLAEVSLGGRGLIGRLHSSTGCWWNWIQLVMCPLFSQLQGWGRGGCDLWGQPPITNSPLD